MDNEITASDALAWLLDNLQEGQVVRWPTGDPDPHERALLDEALAALRRSYL